MIISDKIKHEFDLFPCIEQNCHSKMPVEIQVSRWRRLFYQNNNCVQFQCRNESCRSCSGNQMITDRNVRQTQSDSGDLWNINTNLYVWDKEQATARAALMTSFLYYREDLKTKFSISYSQDVNTFFNFIYIYWFIRKSFWMQVNISSVFLMWYQSRSLT